MARQSYLTKLESYPRLLISRDLRQGFRDSGTRVSASEKRITRMDLLEGVTKDFTADGTLIQRATYLRGQLDGVIVRFG